MENSLSDSILSTIKKLLTDDNYNAFDTDIIRHINSVFSILHQLGLSNGNKAYKITGYNEKWSDFLDNNYNLDMVISYIYMKVKLIFDPPNGSVLDSMKQTISEFEWRITQEESYDG